MMAPKQFGEYVGLLLKLLTPFTRDAKEILGDMLRVPSGPEAAS